MKKIVANIFLFCCLCYSLGYATKLAVLPQIISPTTMEIENNELYILDEFKVYVYSLPRMEFMRSFGEKGEGKGQLIPNTEVPIAMSIYDDKVYLNSQTKMVIFSRKGKMINEKRIPYSFQTIPFGDKFVSIKIAARRTLQDFKVIFYDAEFNPLKTLYSRQRIPQSRRGKLPIPPELVILRSNEEYLFVFDQKKGLAIDVYNLKGDLVKTLNLEHQKIKVSESFKKNAELWFRKQPYFYIASEELRKMIHFPEHLPLMRNFIIKDHYIYIQTYQTQNYMSEFLILNLEGKLKIKTYFPGFAEIPVQFNSSQIFTFYKGQYYYLSEDNGEWGIQVQEIK